MASAKDLSRLCPRCGGALQPKELRFCRVCIESPARQLELVLVPLELPLDDSDSAT